MMTDEQRDFMFLVHGEGLSFSEVATKLNVEYKVIAGWEVSLRDEWQKIAAIRAIYTKKKISTDFRTFYDWYVKNDRCCAYCKITEEEIAQLFDLNPKLTKRGRGRKLELDRKNPDSAYCDSGNIVFACYWCNNAKTDTFTGEEFKKIGEVIQNIWKDRLSK